MRWEEEEEFMTSGDWRVFFVEDFLFRGIQSRIQRQAQLAGILRHALGPMMLQLTCKGVLSIVCVRVCGSGVGEGTV